MTESGGPSGRMSPASLDGLRVLLVEDTWIIAQTYAGLLEPLGITVLGPAANVTEARALLDNDDVHVALVDMNLQGEPADALIEALGKRGVPVVVITGYEVVPRLELSHSWEMRLPVRWIATPSRSLAAPVCAARRASPSS